MAVRTVGDMLKRAWQFEQMLANYYARLARETTREGVRLLTDYMSRHRVRLLEALDKLPRDEIHRICAIPVRYEPQAADRRCITRAHLGPDATAVEVLETAIMLNECLVRLYRQTLQQSEDDQEARDVLESLIRSEERDEIELKKIKAMDYF